MKNNKSVLQYLLDYTELVDEALPGQPVVELLGDSRVLVENYQRILDYGLEQVCIRVRYGTVKILGCNLRLHQVTRQKLLITGKIDRVELLRGDCE